MTEQATVVYPVKDTVNVYTDGDDIIGRELEDGFEHEDLLEALKNAGYSVVVSDVGAKYRDRCYINVKSSENDGWQYDDSFEIDPSLPSFGRLCRSLENEYLEVVRAPDGKFTLVCTAEHTCVEAEIEENEDGSFTVLKLLDEEEDAA